MTVHTVITEALAPHSRPATEAEDPGVAHQAREALEHLCEDMDYRRGKR